MKIATPVLIFLVVCIGTLVADLPQDNPAAHYGYAWTNTLAWDRVVDITVMYGVNWQERLDRAQQQLGDKGGVVYFPPGDYVFTDTVFLQNRIVLRGAKPNGIADACDEDYQLPSRIMFPRFKPAFGGLGTPKDTAFKGIHLADPETAVNCGVVNLAIDSGHIYFAQGSEARNRIVYGCVLTNAALIDQRVPDLNVGQHAWQRFTKWHQAAIQVFAQRDMLIASNRLPASSDHFLQKGYIIQGRGNNKGKSETIEEGVWFDYDNRPGICVNGYCIGGGGGRDPKGTPQTHLQGFAPGLVILENYIYSTGRTAIEFTGQGTICSFNVIRFKPDVTRWTNTGVQEASGSSTNDNRAMTMRGWGYTVEGNDYIIYRNRAGKGPYYINDGEGLMHEGHCNCIVKDCKIINNKGNAYISIYLTAGIDGLLVQGNDIRPRGPGTDTKISSIFVNANRTGEQHPCRNVRITNNVTDGSGILIAGDPAENNVVRNNRSFGGASILYNLAEAEIKGNIGYAVKTKK